jgi:hypothetical protein
MASVTVRKVENAKPEQYIDEGSLMLFVKPSRGKSWFCVPRSMVGGAISDWQVKVDTIPFTA